MKLGLDFYGTIDKAPKDYKRLAEVVLAGGGEVHIISSVMPQNVRQAQKDIKHSHVPHTAVHVIPFTDYFEMAPEKAQKAKELGIDIMIDNDSGVCDWLMVKGILALKP